MKGGFGLLSDEMEDKMQKILTVLKMGEELAIVPTQDAKGGELLMTACVCIDMVSQMYQKDINELTDKFRDGVKMRQLSGQEIVWERLLD